MKLTEGRIACLRAQRGNQMSESGSALLMAVLLIFLLTALALAQSMVVQKNIQSSRFLLSYSDLRSYAESGIALAVHDLRHNLSGNGGKIGTVSWTSANDVGRDGIAGTLDQGEGDGLPTEGEPNINPVPIGPAKLGAGLIVFTESTASPNVMHLVATAFNIDASATVEEYALLTPVQIPRVGAIYVDPGVTVDLSGTVLIDGNDHNPDGTAATAPPVVGIATMTGTPPGANQANLLLQIPPEQYKQVLGLGGKPSLGEYALDLQQLITTFKGLKTYTLPAGTYTDPAMGNSSSEDLHVTYVSGDVHFSGASTGAGVLVVEGSLTVTGQFSFQGLVLVAGDVRLSGSGTEAKVWGSLMVGQALTSETTSTRTSGATTVYYSDSALRKAEVGAGKNYKRVYYDDK